MDGWLTVGTKVDSSGFDKDIESLESKMAIVEKEQKAINNVANGYKKELSSVENSMTKISSEMDSLDSKASKLRNEGQEYSTAYNSVIDKLDNLNIKYQELVSKQTTLNSKINEQNIKYDKLSTRAGDYQNKIDKINNKKHLLELEEAQNKISLLNQGVSKLGNGFSSAISKIAKMAIALFGVASIIGILTNATSTLSQYNEGIAADIAYLQFAIATMLQPIIETIIGLVFKLLSYINYIAKAWFNVNLFANASSKAFQKAQKSTKKMAKDTKEMNKSLASGIDEITNLDDNNNTKDNTADENAGIQVPDYDLGSMDGDVPAWIKWIADNKDIVIAGLLGIAAAILAIKLGWSALSRLGIALIIGGIILLIKGVIDFLKDPTWDNFKKILEGIVVILAGVALVVGGSLGVTLMAIAAAIAGITLIIDGVIKYLKDPSWENFTTILGGIALVVAAVAVLFGGIPALIVAIIAVVGALGLAIYKHWEDIKSALGAVGQWIYDNIIKPVADFFAGLWKGIVNGVKTAVNVVKNVFGSIVSFFSGIISKILSFFKKVGTSVGNIIGSAFKGVVNGVLSAIENILNFPIKSINKLIGVINKVPGINLGKLTTFNLPRLEKGGIVNNPGPGVNMGSYIAGERGAEAIVPLQNSKFIRDFAGEVSNQRDDDMITDLLIELNRNILELTNRPNVIQIDGKEIARTTYKNFKEEENRLNQSDTVRRY